VLDKSKFDYLPEQDRLIGYNGYLSNEKFVKVLGSMDVNLYLAFSESWGNVITESLSNGVPCLSTINSGVYDYDNELSEMLVVHDYDNILSIRNQIMHVIFNQNILRKKCRDYISTVNQKAEEMLIEILDN
jgi:glycosyltransferase involved in cell wall biosynthesis